MSHQIVKALLLSTVLALTPTAAFAETAEEETMETAADTAEESVSKEDLKILGEKTTDADYDPVVKNATGKEIKSIEIQINEEEFGGNLLEEDDIMAVDEERVLYCTPAPYNPEEDATPPKYNIRLTFSDDTEAVIHTFPFGDAETVDFCLDGSVAYLKFLSLSLDEEQDTMRNERALLPVETPSYYYDDSSSNYNYNYSYSYSSGGSSDSYSNGSAESGSSGGGSTDGGGTTDGGGGTDAECLTGGLLF